MALDPRHLGKPPCFDGTQEGSCDEWLFQLVASLAAVARRTTPYLLSDLPPDEEEKKVYLSLYSVIVLRKLDAEYRPTYRGRQMD